MILRRNSASVLLFTLLLSACGKSQPPPAIPAEVAQGNLIEQFTEGGFDMLADSYCDADVLVSPSNVRYVKCSAKTKGYAHYDTYYCRVTRKSSCDLRKPE